jgi:hypothetical protein
MGEYALLFRGRDMGKSPEEIQRTIQTWRAWFDGLAKNGHLKDPGHPLTDARTTVSGRLRAVNDGPYVETKDLVAGFILIAAADLAQAVELAKGCPILDVNGSVEVCPIAAMGA